MVLRNEGLRNLNKVFSAW